jgi:hypothetical protein
MHVFAVDSKIRDMKDAGIDDQDLPLDLWDRDFYNKAKKILLDVPSTPGLLVNEEQAQRIQTLANHLFGFVPEEVQAITENQEVF